MKIDSYVIRILRNQSLYYFGEVIVNGVQEIQTNYMASELNAIKALNRNIQRFNTTKDVNLPKFPEVRGNPPIVFNTTTPTPAVSEPEPEPKPEPKSEPKSEPKLEEPKLEIIEAAPLPKKPKRKPFTPYGLDGYLVDKQGNVRLMLDRRANAHTIVLEPQMFNALAEMVKRTQEAKNATS